MASDFRFAQRLTAVMIPLASVGGDASMIGDRTSRRGLALPAALATLCIAFWHSGLA